MPLVTERHNGQCHYSTGLEVMASVALVLVLMLLQKFHIDFQWKCPLQNKNGLALSKMKFQASSIPSFALEKLPQILKVKPDCVSPQFNKPNSHLWPQSWLDQATCTNKSYPVQTSVHNGRYVRLTQALAQIFDLRGQKVECNIVNSNCRLWIAGLMRSFWKGNSFWKGKGTKTYAVLYLEKGTSLRKLSISIMPTKPMIRGNSLHCLCAVSGLKWQTRPTPTLDYSFNQHELLSTVVSFRSIPEPNLPDGVSHRLSANYYFTRDGRRESKPGTMVYSGVKRLAEPKPVSEGATAIAAAKPVTPGGRPSWKISEDEPYLM